MHCSEPSSARMVNVSPGFTCTRITCTNTHTQMPQLESTDQIEENPMAIKKNGVTRNSYIHLSSRIIKQDRFSAGHPTDLQRWHNTHNHRVTESGGHRVHTQINEVLGKLMGRYYCCLTRWFEKSLSLLTILTGRTTKTSIHKYYSHTQWCIYHNLTYRQVTHTNGAKNAQLV